MKAKIIAAAIAIAAPIAVAQSAKEPYEVVTVALPSGSVTAGREAFRDLKCYLCHRVAGEKQFPAPASQAQGPDLGEHLRVQAASDVAAAIIAPSHSVSVRSSEVVKKRLASEDLSPMGDFSTTLTVRQLADLLAYLRSPAARR